MPSIMIRGDGKAAEALLDILINYYLDYLGRLI